MIRTPPLPTFPLAFVLLSCLALAGFSPAHAGESTPPTVHIVLVLDVSGSMAEESRFDRMVTGVAATLTILPDGAEVAVVAFNHEARTVAPLTRLTNANRDDLLARVEKLRPDGGTDILAGATAAVSLLADTGGVVVLLSDGLQTGNSNTPLPESNWGPALREVVRKAGKHGVTITTIGLGPDAGKEVLGALAEQTGGEFIPVKDSAELVARYVDLAAIIGQHWTRTTSGPFAVTQDEEVILVDTVKAPPRLYQSVDGRAIPVSFVYRIERFGVRAERFKLAPGEHRFDAAGKPPPTVLRPMRVTFQLPALTTLAANRDERIEVKAVTRDGKDGLKNLTLNSRLTLDGKPLGEPVTVTVGGEGSLAVPVRTPPRTGQLQAILEAEQNGWHRRLGTYSAKLMSPEPVGIRLNLPEGPVSLQSIGEQRTAEVAVEVTGLTPGGPPVELNITASDPDVGVRPARVRVTGPSQKITLTLSRKSTAAVLQGTLRFVPNCDDLVPPRVNGDKSASLAFTWRHLTPALRLYGLQSIGEPVAAKRGGDVTVHAALAGTDIDAATQVRFSTASLPARFEVAVPEKERITLGQTGRVEIPLRVRIAKDVLPGRHELPIVLTPPDGVTLNGSPTPLRHTLAVMVSPVEVRTRVVEGGGDWAVIAPTSPVSRTVVVEAAAVDGGALPELVIGATAPAPIEVVLVRTTSVAAGNRRAEFRLTLPAQAAPFTGTARFGVNRVDGIIPIGCSIDVSVPPVVVTASIEPAEVHRFSDWQQRVFGWLRPEKRTGPFVHLDGEGVEEAGCIWSLGDVGGDHVSVVLTSRYRHTVFAPADRIDVPVRVVVKEVPWPVWAASGSVLLLLALAWFRPWPLKVTLDTGEVVRGWSSIRIDRLANRPGPRLKLRRTMFGSLRLSSRGQSGCVVAVVTPEAGRQTLVRGQTIRVSAGDRVEFGSPTDPDGVWGVTIGGWAAAESRWPAEDRDETKPAWLS